MRSACPASVSCRSISSRSSSDRSRSAASRGSNPPSSTSPGVRRAALDRHLAEHEVQHGRGARLRLHAMRQRGRGELLVDAHGEAASLELEHHPEAGGTQHGRIPPAQQVVVGSVEIVDDLWYEPADDAAVDRAGRSGAGRELHAGDERDDDPRSTRHRAIVQRLGTASVSCRLRHSVHTDAVITSTASNHSQRTVYSKYGPKMRAIDTTASTHATASNACRCSSAVARRDRAARTAIAQSTSRPTNPTAATASNESRPGPNTHGPSRLNCTPTISATSPSPRYGPSGWRKLSIRIDTLPGERRN